jgi:hypothetical protein
MNAIFYICILFFSFYENNAGQFSAIAQGATTVMAAFAGIVARKNFDDSLQTTKNYQKLISVLYRSEWARQAIQIAPNRSYKIDECIFTILNDDSQENGRLALQVVTPEEQFTLDAKTFLQLIHNAEEKNESTSQSKLIKNITRQVGSSFSHYKNQMYFYGWCCLISSCFLLWEMVKYKNKFMVHHNDIPENFYD